MKKIILLIGIVSLLLISGCNPNSLPDCQSEIIEECYRTEPTGSLSLHLTIDIQTRCSEPYDFKVRKSKDWTNCNPIYEKVYK